MHTGFQSLIENDKWEYRKVFLGKAASTGRFYRPLSFHEKKRQMRQDFEVQSSMGSK